MCPDDGGCAKREHHLSGADDPGADCACGLIACATDDGDAFAEAGCGCGIGGDVSGDFRRFDQRWEECEVDVQCGGEWF